MMPSCVLNLAPAAPIVARGSLHQQARTPALQRAHISRLSMRCAAKAKDGGKKKKGAASSSGPETPQADAAETRAEAADTAGDAIKDAGDQLADALGSGVENAEGAVADTQAQAAGGAARAENTALDTSLQSATPDTRRAAVEASVSAEDARRQAAAASVETRSTQKEDAALAEDAVREQASEVAEAVTEGVESIPTPAEGLKGAADGAADAIRGAGQAAGQTSEAAEGVQKDAEGFAADLQKNAQQASQELQAGVNRAAEQAQQLAAEARRAADNVQKGSPYRRGRELISNTAPLTAMSPAAPDGESGEDAVPYLKIRLLAHVAGLDRGFAATGRQADLVESAVQALVSASGPVNLTGSSSSGAGGPLPPSTVSTPVSITNVGVTSISPEVTSISPSAADSVTPGATLPGGTPAPLAPDAPKRDTLPGGTPAPLSPGAPSASATPGSNPVPPQGQPLPPPGAGFATGAAAPGSPGAVGSDWSSTRSSGGSGGIAGSGGGGGSGSGSGKQLLGGVWRLVYSSGFAGSRSIGGRRPGLPLKLLPADFGQVYQGIDTQLGRLDNVVELRRGPLPSLPFGPKNQPAEALLTLKHALQITGPRTVQITFTGTDVSLQGGIAGLLNNIPEFSVPELPEGLRPSSGMRASTFDILFLDEDLRVTRGDRNEIRVFLRT